MTEKKETALKKIIEYLGRESVGFTQVLAVSYAVSFVASLYFFFDLFSHFTLQYAIGGFFLGALLLTSGRKRWALLAFAICVGNAVESRINLQEPLAFSASSALPAYKIATYNHNYARRDFKEIEDWLRKLENNFDAVVLQEATQKTVEMTERLSDIYPYQILEPRDHAFGMVILSRWPFSAVEKIPLNGPYYQSFALKFSIHPEGVPNFTIYAVHPHPPTTPLGQAQRNFELLAVAEKTSAENDVNAIMIGDWNITPFAPVFRKILQISNLHYQSYGLLLNPTWPSFNRLTFLKIPIDHVLFSNNLIQLYKKTGPAFGSDHHILMAGFTQKEAAP